MNGDGFTFGPVKRRIMMFMMSLAILGACLMTVQMGDGCDYVVASPIDDDLFDDSGSPCFITGVVSSCPDAGSFVIDHVVYGTCDDDAVEALGFDGFPATDVTIPPKVTSPDGMEHVVVRIADDAFRDMAPVESVVISDTVAEVGRNAFSGCVSLNSLTVPVTLKCHYGEGDYAFNDVCLDNLTLTKGAEGSQGEDSDFWRPMTGMLRGLVVDEGVSSFTTSFKDSSHLESVTLKDVESIREDQFRDCKNLLTVVAPKVRTIDDNAFMYCSRLNTVDLTSLESFSRGIFVHCTSLRTVVSDMLFIDDGQLFMILDDNNVSLIQQLEADSRIVAIPVEVASSSGRNYAVTEIGKEAFREHGNLGVLIIPDDVRKVDEHAFYRCGSIDCISVPIGIDCSCHTGKAAFEGVKTKTLILTSGGYDSEGYMDNEFWKPFVGSLESLFLDEGITDFKTSFKGSKLMNVLMDGVKTVHKNQFRDCEKLILASFHEATTVGKSAFMDSDSLVSVDASEVKYVEDEAFRGCLSLEEFKNDSLETVGEMGFFGCIPLEKINFDNITAVGSKAFQDTAVTDAPISKSCYFAEDSFGSSLENGFKYMSKNMKVGVTVVLSTLGAASLVSLVNTVQVALKAKEAVSVYETVTPIIDAELKKDTGCDFELVAELDKKRVKLADEYAEMPKYWKYVLTACVIATVVTVVAVTSQYQSNT